MSYSSHNDEVVLWRKTLVLLTFIPFLTSQMEGRASVSLEDLNPCVRKLVRKLHGIFFWLISGGTDIHLSFLKTLPVS